MKKIIGQPQFLKKINAEQIEQLIFEKGPISKPELARLSGLSLPTVNKLVGLLEDENKVKSVGLMGGGAGRKAKVYVANKQSGSYIILYFQNNEFLCYVTDIVGGIIYECTTKSDGSSGNIELKDIYTIIEKMINQANNDVKAIGIGVPGVVKTNNIITSIPSIPQLEGINLKEIIEKKYKIPTFVENDVKLTTVGYYHQNLKKKYRDIVYIYIGQGLGSGIILNKKLHKGFTSFAGELGYMVFDHVSDNENYAINGGVLESTIRKIQNEKENVVVSDLVEDYNKKISRLISYSIANIISIINPQVIVFGGELVSKHLLHSVKENIKKIIPSDNEPILLHDINGRYGVDGAINMCISNISSNIKVINEKGV